VHPNAVAFVENSSSMALKLQPVHMPMLIPPKPWTGISQGGHLTNRWLPLQLQLWI
jgi:DNA-directed RNA polymerase